MTSERSKLKYLRIYADADGESHMEELDIALLPKQISLAFRLLHCHQSHPLLASASAAFPRA
jgi:hypothetical protein